MKLSLPKVLCLAAFALLAVSATAQVKDMPPLQFRISLKKLDRQKKSMSIKLKLINVGNKSIVIDKNSLGYSVSIIRLGEKRPGGGITSAEGSVATGDPGPNYKGDYLVLAPKQSYGYERDFSIDGPFFEKGRNFTILLTYGQFMEVRFQGSPVWRGAVDSNLLRFSN